jgi:hypothetical protein
MAEKQTGSETPRQVDAPAKSALPRVNPRVAVVGDLVQVEFRIEDLVRRVIPSAAGHCGGCYGCSGCNH